MNTVREEKLSIGAAVKLCQRMSTHAKDWSVPRLFSTTTSCFPVSDSIFDGQHCVGVANVKEHPERRQLLLLPKPE